MTLKINGSMAVTACDALVDRVDAGAGNSKLIVYGGDIPSEIDEPISTQTALVTFDLPNPAFGDAVDQGDFAEAVANVIPDQVGAADGEASFFRILDGDGVEIIQGDVTGTTCTGALKLTATDIRSGITAVVASLTALMPKG